MLNQVRKVGNSWTQGWADINDSIDTYSRPNHVHFIDYNLCFKACDVLVWLLVGVIILLLCLLVGVAAFFGCELLVNLKLLAIPCCAKSVSVLGKMSYVMEAVLDGSMGRF